jgi:hypothetical protein
MLSKCANASCSAPFLYLHSGKLFRMDVPVDSTPGNNGEKKSACRVEFFWLCNECANTMTLSYRQGIGVVATPLGRTRAAGVLG